MKDMRVHGVMGDFNEILTQPEKQGGRCHTSLHIKQCHNAIESIGLNNLGWKGQKYTQSNWHIDESFTKERLNRTLANREWMLNIEGKAVETIPSSRLDHIHIMLYINDNHLSVPDRQRLYRFKAKWIQEADGELLSQMHGKI